MKEWFLYPANKLSPYGDWFHGRGGPESLHGGQVQERWADASTGEVGVTYIKRTHTTLFYCVLVRGGCVATVKREK